jgi:hypothetical protein
VGGPLPPPVAGVKLEAGRRLARLVSPVVGGRSHHKVRDPLGQRVGHLLGLTPPLPEVGRHSMALSKSGYW